MSPFDAAIDLAVTDPFEAALLDRGSGGEMLVERSGGGLNSTSLRWWLRLADQPAPVDFGALGLIRSGPVLDIGCATGRHIEALGHAGLAAEGIDLNPAAVALARLHGCAAQCADFWTFRPARRYRWLLALGNNLGVAGRLASLPAFLHHCADLLAPGGEVLLSSVDWRHPAAQVASRGQPGEMRLRLHYAGRAGAWFDWVYVAPDALATAARAAGFTCDIVDRFDEVYVAVLRLSPVAA
jgi:SAM-dependent methyltransferase